MYLVVLEKTPITILKSRASQKCNSWFKIIDNIGYVVKQLKTSFVYIQAKGTVGFYDGTEVRVEEKVYQMCVHLLSPLLFSLN